MKLAGESIERIVGLSGKRGAAIFFVGAIFLASLAHAQLPQTISYQGYLSTVGGLPVHDSSYTITFKLYNVASGGSALWTEAHSNVSTAKGTFSVILGSVTPLTGVDFNQQLYLGVTKGTDSEFSPRSVLTSSPSSLAPWATSGNDIFYSGGNVGVGTTNPLHTFHLSSSSETVLNLQSTGTGGRIWQLYSTGPQNGEGAGHFLLRDGTAGIVRMFASGSTGNIGVGTSNPAFKLDVNGIVNATDIYKNGSPFTGASQWTTSGSNIYYSAGNVGIGTASPNYKLHIKGAAEGISIQGVSSLSSNAAFLTFRDSAATRIGYVGDGSSADEDVFLSADLGNVVLNTSGGRVLTATPNGNVGIGTTTPNERLTVGGSMEIGTGAGDYQHCRIGGGNSSGFIYGSYPKYSDGIHLGYNYYANSSGTGVIPATGGATSRLSLGYGWIGLYAGHINSEPNFLALYANYNGVGIGTTNPQYPLDVAGMSHFSSNSGTAVSAYSPNSSAVLGSSGYIGVEGISNNASIGEIYGMYSVATNSSGDDVGIYAEADVNSGATSYGVLAVASGGSSNWGGYFTGSIYTTGSYNSSDRKLKNNLKPLDSALSIIDQLKPSEYTYKTNDYPQMHLPEGLHYGLVADELQPVLPGLVKKAVQPAVYENHDERNGKKLSDAVEFDAVNYTELIPVLIKAIQEQQELIGGQAKQISDLRALVTSLTGAKK